MLLFQKGFSSRISPDLCFFTDRPPFRQSILEVVADESPFAVVVDLGSATLIDMDGTEVLTMLQEELGRKNIRMVLARVENSQLEILSKTGTLDAIGLDNVFETVRHAVAVLQNQPVWPLPPEEPPSTFFLRWC